MADHIGTHFFSARKKSEPAALSAAWPTWPLHSPEMTFRAGEKVLSQEHGLRAFFSYRRRTPVAVPPKKCAKQESAASGCEDTNIQFKQSARMSLHSQIASL